MQKSIHHGVPSIPILLRRDALLAGALGTLVRVYWISVSELVIFVCTSLVVYWFSRALLLLNGSEEKASATLECDLWRGRRLLHALRVPYSKA
jgi:hypothetical protein